jgi:hypothetical protein
VSHLLEKPEYLSKTPPGDLFQDSLGPCIILHFPSTFQITAPLRCLLRVASQQKAHGITHDMKPCFPLQVEIFISASAHFCSIYFDFEPRCMCFWRFSISFPSPSVDIHVVLVVISSFYQPSSIEFSIALSGRRTVNWILAKNDMPQIFENTTGSGILKGGFHEPSVISKIVIQWPLQHLVF